MTALALNRRNDSVGMPNIDSPMIPPTTPPPFLKPVNTGSPTTATGTGSLYHLCRSVLDRLSTIDGMTTYIDSVKDTTDPLLKLTLICREGYPLCTLYNALNPIKPLSIDVAPNLNALNSCKANVYHFIVACIKDLSFQEDDMFTISDLYQNDTNGFVKVVNTINKILQLLENRGIIKVQSINRNSDPNAPKNTRDKVVLELLETERKYVQDMEILQNYMRELQIQKVVSPDTIHYLFGNLNALVDFQRRFLIQLEEIAEKSPEEQRIGSLFIQMEEPFSVYEPYCSNFFSAQDLVVQETPRLQKLADMINPVYELPSMLIKPIQRICKYPLLLQELAKSTDKDWFYYQETQLAVQAIKRVAEKVNETQRQHENVKAVQDLKKRLEVFKNDNLDNYGKLLLQDKLSVSTNPTENNHNNDRELHVFLFEHALLLCKESKGSNLLTKSNTLSINKKKRRGSLVLKVEIATGSMALPSSQLKNGVWSLYSDVKRPDFDRIALRLKNEEHVKLWTNTLSKAIQRSIDIIHESNHPIPVQPISLYSECDIEEECENDLYDDEEEDYMNLQRLNIHGHPPSSFRGKLGPTQTQDYNSNNAGRPYHNVPGMNLSPLPRSHSSLTTQSSISVSPPPHYNNYYPVSPPPSYPSSPITAAVITNSEDQYYQYYQQAPYQNSLLSSGRSMSQSAAVDTRPTMSLNQNRLRSQSTPNIMKNSPSTILMTPSYSNQTSSSSSSSSSTSSDKMSHIRALRPSSHEAAPQSLRPTPSKIHLNENALPPTPGMVKIKLVFHDGIYAINVCQDSSYLELMEKVESKIRLVTPLKPNDLLRLKYQDEDGDYITINSDDDIQMAFESRGNQNSTSLFVSV